MTTSHFQPLHAALQAQGHTLLIATHDPALIAALDREVRL